MAEDLRDAEKEGWEFAGSGKFSRLGVTKKMGQTPV
jgi:hypothetical protein